MSPAIVLTCCQEGVSRQQTGRTIEVEPHSSLNGEETNSKESKVSTDRVTGKILEEDAAQTERSFKDLQRVLLEC